MSPVLQTGSLLRPGLSSPPCLAVRPLHTCASPLALSPWSPAVVTVCDRVAALVTGSCGIVHSGPYDLVCGAGDGVLTPAISGEPVFDWSAQRSDLERALDVLTPPQVTACTHRAALQRTPRGAVTPPAACLGGFKSFLVSCASHLQNSSLTIVRTDAWQERMIVTVRCVTAEQVGSVALALHETHKTAADSQQGALIDTSKTAQITWLCQFLHCAGQGSQLAMMLCVMHVVSGMTVGTCEQAWSQA